MISDETFLIVDVEADGPIPGRHSMLSFAAVAFKLDKTIIGEFSRNLETLPEATTYPATMKWWEGFPAAWAACRSNPIAPEVSLPEFLDWMRSLPSLPLVFLANPVSYDWIYMHHYLCRFTDYVHSINDASPLYLTALDMRSFGAALLNKPFRYAGKPNYPKAWKAHGLPHTHLAIDDAREHAMTFCAMAQTAREMHAALKEHQTCAALPKG